MKDWLTLRTVFAGYFIVLTALLVGLWLASPGSESKEILGLIVRSEVGSSQRVFISNRWIRCVPERWEEAPGSTCTIELFGETLEIVAARNPAPHPIQLGGNCTAFYDGRKQTCTLSTYRGEVWFIANVYLGNRINVAQQRALKRRHILGNLPSSYYVRGTLVIAVLTAFVVGVMAYFSILKTVSSPPKLAQKLSFFVSSSMVGLIVGVLSLFVCMRITGAFW